MVGWARWVRTHSGSQPRCQNSQLEQCENVSSNNWKSPLPGLKAAGFAQSPSIAVSVCALAWRGGGERKSPSISCLPCGQCQVTPKQMLLEIYQGTALLRLKASDCLCGYFPSNKCLLLAVLFGSDSLLSGQRLRSCWLFFFLYIILLLISAPTPPHCTA